MTVIELMSKKQLTEYLGISPRTLDRMQASGNLPERIKIPGTSTYRYRKVDVDSWLESEGKANDLSIDESV